MVECCVHVQMFMCVASYVSFTKTPVTLSSVATATAWRS